MISISEHFAHPPYSIKEFSTGYCAILNNHGINPITGGGGGTLFRCKQEAEHALKYLMKKGKGKRPPHPCR